MVLVKDIMTKDPESVQASDLVTKARSIMREQGYRSFPIIEDGRIEGIVTRGDVMRVTSSKTNLLVDGIMTKNLITTTPDEDIFSCTREMIKAGIRQFPVVENEKLVGIISSSDILTAFVEHDYNPVKKKISDTMVTGNIVCCEPEDELSSIWDKMYSSGFSGFPVIKKDQVIGVITRRDIIRDGSVRLSKESGKGRVVYVKKAMRTPAITVKPGVDVKDAAALMLKKKISKLPVTDEKNKLVGIIDIADILKAYAG